MPQRLHKKRQSPVCPQSTPIVRSPPEMTVYPGDYLLANIHPVQAAKYAGGTKINYEMALTLTCGTELAGS